MIERQFGIEFEHLSKLSHHDMANLLAEHKVPVDQYATGTHRCPEGCYSGWQVKTDSSITAVEKYPYGVELVTPPMTFKQANEVRRALKVIVKHGGVNSSCGLHVHVHAPEFSRMREDSGDFRLFELAWLYVEKVFFSYVPLSRRRNDFCRPGVDLGERYQALNLQPLLSDDDRRQTVEFRLHSGTLNYNKALAFAYLCTHFIQRMVDMRQLWLDKRDKILAPDLYSDQPVKLIKNRKGDDVSLERKDRKWRIKSKAGAIEVDDLQKAFTEFGKDLNLLGRYYLIAFRYPTYGNAMTELCKLLSLEGPFRGYLEDRYERMLAKHGVMGNSVTDEAVEDEDDYYSEEDFDDRAVGGRQ